MARPLGAAPRRRRRWSWVRTAMATSRTRALSSGRPPSSGRPCTRPVAGGVSSRGLASTQPAGE
eukprot:4763765-Alexandrium_andersonii.AAC.1